MLMDRKGTRTKGDRLGWEFNMSIRSDHVPSQADPVLVPFRSF